MDIRARATLVVAALMASTLVLGGCGLGVMSDSRRPVDDDPADRPTVKIPEDTGDAFSRAEEIEIFKNLNDGAITGSSTQPVTFTLEKQTTISYIQTYHWDSGKPPGEISLKGEDGTVYGPWTAVGTEGQGGMPNAYWEVEPNESLEQGTYTVVDSDPGSWSTNEQMGGAGQTIVRGYPEE